MLHGGFAGGGGSGGAEGEVAGGVSGAEVVDQAVREFPAGSFRRLNGEGVPAVTEPQDAVGHPEASADEGGAAADDDALELDSFAGGESHGRRLVRVEALGV